MIITIKNFGPIKEFEFDTATDFMLMVGENNVGKSYAVSVIYIVIKVFLHGKERIYRDNEFYSEVNRLLDFLCHEVVPNSKEVSLTDAANKSIKELFERTLVNRLNRSMQNTFGSLYGLNNNCIDKAFEIRICWNGFGVTFKLSGGLLKISDYSFFKKVVMDHDDIVISSFYGCEIRVRNEMPHSILLKPLTDFFSIDTSYYGIDNIYYLPSAKSGLYLALSAFGPIFAYLSQERPNMSKQVDIPAIPEPLSDYYLYLTNSDGQASKTYSQYFTDIENNILQGKISFDNVQKRLLYNPNNTELNLDLSNTSSMVAEVAPLTAFLKFVIPFQPSLSFQSADTKYIPLLIIEEPEAHIHPANQVKLIKILAKLVKDGKIKLIITSHSNYLFNQCSNLVMDGSIDKDSFRSVLLRPNEIGSEAVDLEVDEYGIQDKNFVDTAEEIFEEKLKLFDKVNGIV
ncbi:MAG: AAA family ATPase [Methylomonas sp.]|nr:AAA family ATPase [Methylomonas sp.]